MKRSHFFKLFLGVLPLALALATTPALAHPATSREKNYDQISNYLQFAPLLIGAGTAYYKDDMEGEKQLLRSTLAGVLATQALKYSMHGTAWDTRPNGGDYSFPSGHTSFACSGAAYMGERYGWEYSMPSLIIAAGVGAARVEAGKHHVRDVVAGCGLSYGVNEFFVTKIGEEQLYPVIGPDIIGFRWKFTL